jgi:dihydrofolate reductase
MKVILYMAMTVNGLIANLDDSVDFLMPEESKSYVSHVVEAGALIVGRRTYEILSQRPEFQEFSKADVKIVVVSQSNFKLKDLNHLVAHSPKDALEALSNFETVIVAGGAKLNASFLAENLIDELYLDIEPALLGKGIPLFDRIDFDCALTFLSSKNLSENEIQLHYKILK